MREEPEVEVIGLLHLRLAAMIPLVATAAFLPFDLRGATPGMVPWLLLVYGISAGWAGIGVLATYRAWTPHQGNRVAFLVAMGLGINTSLYLLVEPEHVLPVSDALICLMMASALLFAWGVRRMVLLCAVTCGAFALVALGSERVAAVEVRPWLALAGVAVGAASAIACTSVLERYRARLARRQAELSTLSTRLMATHEESRRLLSHELHEGVSQSLTASLSYLWLVDRKLPPDQEELRSCLSEGRRLASGTLSEIRRLSQSLHPPALDDYGLVPSLEGQLRAFGQRHSIESSFVTEGLVERLPREVETAIYRITQEALDNVARHAHARHVEVALAVGPDSLELSVDDDGVGFPPELGQNGITGTGLIAIRERARALGGTLSLKSEGGASVRVSLPLGR
jgi:signal transduction histidine kinase